MKGQNIGLISWTHLNSISTGRHLVLTSNHSTDNAIYLHRQYKAVYAAVHFYVRLRFPQYFLNCAVFFARFEFGHSMTFVF